MASTVNTRELILGILLEVTQKKEYSHVVIRNVLEKYQYLEKQDRAFISRIAVGTMEQMILIDYIIDQFSKTRVSRMKPVISNILRMSVYQMRFMDHVPHSAICNEAVKLAQKKGFANLKGFVNGVLRNISRNLEHIEYPDEELDEILYLSVMYSVPEWLVKLWLKSYPYMTVKVILENFLEEKETAVRCNLQSCTPQELKEVLEKEGVKVRQDIYLDYAFHIKGYNYLYALESFQKGRFQVQDVSSMLTAEIASPKEGDFIIDVCAAPGGKSLHLAEKLKGTGFVEARDLTEYKISLIQENIVRAKCKNIRAVVADALKLKEDSVEKADIVMADLPCSGLGVIGKKVDIKYRMTQETLQELAALQREILSIVWRYVKKGGVLIYSTCTVNEEENIGNVRWFLENYPFCLEPISQYLDEKLRSKETDAGYIQLLPGVHKADGFFIARLKRID